MTGTGLPSGPPPVCRPRGFGPGGKRLAQLRTFRRLGLGNVAAVAAYRLALKTGIARRLTPAGDALPPPVFATDLRPPEAASTVTAAARDAVLEEARAARDGQLAYFGWEMRDVGSPPDWQRNPVTDTWAMDVHWTRIPDFDPTLGDIKQIWEASRFHWAPLFAHAARATGDSAWVDLLNDWLADWCDANPVNIGPNWKCGQETGLRLLAVFEAARLLERDPAGAVPFVAAHLARIAPTMRYAIAQRNNHATSEAAALFAGGGWLAAHGDAPLKTKGQRWRDLGRRWLERSARTLIEPDGGFAQGSANYHRLMMDTLCAAEHWRRHLDEPPFSTAVRKRLAAAADWLVTMTDPQTGLAPNLGPNDGAWFLRMPGCAYADFRPAAARASHLFRDIRPYPPGPWDPESPAVTPAARPGRDFPDSGYHVLTTGRVWAMVRTAHRFRPSQADALHVDLWRDGVPILADGGTYSYNGDPDWTAWFPSAGAHNAPVFDGMDAMPRLGRFLYADWIAARSEGPAIVRDTALELTTGYTARDGRTCRRTLTLGEDMVRITDEVSGHQTALSWRFRLGPGPWQMDGPACTRPGVRITLDGGGAPPALVPDWESTRYGEISPAKALEVALDGAPGPATLTLVITFIDTTQG